MSEKLGKKLNYLLGLKNLNYLGENMDTGWQNVQAFKNLKGESENDNI